MLSDHNNGIGSAQILAELADKKDLGDEDVKKAVTLIQALLPHVSDCEGLSIMVERMDDNKLQSILNTRDRARKDRLNLLEWADTIRERPVVKPL